MDVTSTSSSTTTSTTTSDSSTSTTESGTLISSDFETFLKMLTTQMNNQDPLNPMDSSDFAVQLATFSGVEQQVQTNDLLTSMAEQLGAMSMSDLASWVGMEARTVTSAYFDGQPLTLQPEPVSGAASTFVVAYDANGNEVDRVEIPVSDEAVEWSGIGSDGNAFASGLYSFNLESYSNGELIADEQMAVYSEVVEARVEDGDTILVLAGGNEVSASDVDALRMPQTD